MERGVLSGHALESQLMSQCLSHSPLLPAQGAIKREVEALMYSSGLGQLTQCEDLPEQDPKGPHITQGGVKAVEDALWGHPLQRQEGL